MRYLNASEIQLKRNDETKERLDVRSGNVRLMLTLSKAQMAIRFLKA